MWQDEDMPIKKWAYDVLIGYVSTPSCPGRKGTHTNYCCALVPERPFVAQTIFSLVRKNVLPQWIWDINAVASYINNFFLLLPDKLWENLEVLPETGSLLEGKELGHSCISQWSTRSCWKVPIQP